MSFTVDHHFMGPGSYRKARPASVSSSGFHSQRRRPAYSQPSSLDSLETFNGDMTRRSEKEILQALNDRFAGYIDKVRNLEMHNRNLEAEAAALRQSQAGRSSVGEHYERELNDLRGLQQQLTGEKTRAALEHEHLEEDIQHLRVRMEDEARNREELEAATRAMKKYAEECRLARMELDKKLRALEEEAAFLKKNHEEEVSELLVQIQGAQVSFDMRDMLKADVTSALREIRSQLDSHASKSATHAEEWFKVRMERLSDAAKSNQDAIRGTQEEIGEYRRQLQSRTIELETLRGTKDSLERQRMESEDRHQDDLNSLQETINQLDNELKSTKWEMAGQLRDYQDLLNVKMALDIEIAAYRKLLEGEENRFVSGGTSYSYMESRISTHIKVKAEEISDTVIVEEQTDETQVTEVTEEADEEEEEDKKEEAGEEEEEGDDTKEEEGEDEEEKQEEEGEEEKEEEEEEEGEKAEEEKEEEQEKGEEGEEEKGESPQSKSPAVKSPESKSPQKSPESKSPAAKSPMPKSPAKSPAVKSPAGDESKSPESKSPPSKSPESKSPPPKTPEQKSPEKEKAKPVDAKDTHKEEKKEEKPQPVKEEKKEKEQPVKEDKKQEPKDKEPEKTDKPDPKKESKVEEAPKKEEASKPETPSKPSEDKPTSKPEPKESAPPAKEQKPSAPPSEKAETEAKAASKAAPEKAESKKEDKKPDEKPVPKVEPEKTESKKEEKKPEDKKETSKGESKDAKEGAKMEKAEKSSATESKDSKEEKAKK